MRFLLWKWRKYPIIRDEQGRSLRRQAFDLFDRKHRPTEIYKKQLVPAKLTTLLRYYEDWKKQGGHFAFAAIRKALKNNPDFSEKLILPVLSKIDMRIEQQLTTIGQAFHAVCRIDT